MKIAIDPKNIKALIPLAGKNDIRFYLNSVFLEASVYGSKLIATNGHCVGVIRSDFTLDETDQTEDTVELIIPLHIAQLLAKAKMEFAIEIGERKDLSNTRDCTAIIDNDINIGFTSMDGEYPAWRKVVDLKNDEEYESAQFAPKLIAAFSKTAKALGSKNGHFQIWHRGESGAGVYIDVDTNFFGVIMPMTFRTKRSQTPNWVLEATGSI